MRTKLINAFVAAIILVSVTIAAFSFSSASAGTTKNAETTVVKTCYPTYCVIRTYEDGVLIHEETQAN